MSGQPLAFDKGNDPMGSSKSDDLDPGQPLPPAPGAPDPLAGVRLWILPDPWKTLRVSHRSLDGACGAAHRLHRRCGRDPPLTALDTEPRPEAS